MKIRNYPKIYLDHASATPIDRNVLKQMNLFDRRYFVNAGAVYPLGVFSRNVIEESREKIAKLLSAHSDEIIFTGSGTESIALAIVGVIKNYELRIKDEKLEYRIPHIVTTNIEHSAVLENCRLLEDRGEVEVTYVKVNEKGVVNPKDVKTALKENTILVSVMYVNNEIGTIEPIEEIAKEIRHFKKQNIKKSEFDKNYPLFHTDACQAMNYLPTTNIEKLGVDMLSFNSSKIYGPKGVGVLFKKRNVKLFPIYSGGGQEFGLRSGTENTSAVLGASLSLELVSKIKQSEVRRLTLIRDYGIKKLLDLSLVFPYKFILNGDIDNRLPNNINISILGISSELIVIELGAKGIMVSEKSACGSGDNTESHVISALRCGNNEVKDSISGSIRITLGRDTKKKDMDVLVKILQSILLKYKGWK